MIDRADIPADLLECKETLAMIIGVDGDVITVSKKEKQDFQKNLAAIFVELLSVEEFRKIDDAYMLARGAETAASVFSNTVNDGPDAEVEATAMALDDAASAAWDHMTEVMAKVLNRPVPDEQ